VQRVRGPVTVVVVDNPFRYPWTVTVGHQVITAPPPVSQLPAGISAPGSPTALPSEAPTTIGGVPGAPSPTPAPYGVTLLAPPGGVTVAKSACPATRFDAIEACIRTLELELEQTRNHDIQYAYESICAAQLEYLALEARADRILSTTPLDTDKRRQNAVRRIAELQGDSRGQLQAACSKTEATQRTIYGIRMDSATVRSAQDAIKRARPFPSDAIAAEGKQADDITTQLGAYSVEKVDKETDQDILAFYECNRRAKAKLAPAVSRQKANTKNNAAKTTAETARSAVCKNPKSQQTVARSGSFRIDQAKARLASIKATLQLYAPTAPYPTQFNAALAQLYYLRAAVLSDVGVNRFFVKVDENCRGLYGAQGKTTITVSRTPGENNSIIVDCPSRAFASFGFAFEYLPQQTVGAVGANTALAQPPPNGATPPPYTLQATTSSDVREVPVVLFHVLMTQTEKGDSGWFATFGVGFSTIPPATTLGLTDYFVGASYSMSRQLVGTLGFAYGHQQVLYPGYRVNDPLGSQTVVVPQDRARIIPFLSVTYGQH
jgi:hypothetical protein